MRSSKLPHVPKAYLPHQCPGLLYDVVAAFCASDYGISRVRPRDGAVTKEWRRGRRLRIRYNNGGRYHRPGCRLEVGLYFTYYTVQVRPYVSVLDSSTLTGFLCMKLHRNYKTHSFMDGVCVFGNADRPSECLCVPCMRAHLRLRWGRRRATTAARRFVENLVHAFERVGLGSGTASGSAFLLNPIF